MDLQKRFMTFVQASESAEQVWAEIEEGDYRPAQFIYHSNMEDSGFYHVCTDGTVLPWMFKDDQDFIGGINRIGICKIISGVSVWAYTLMDNHVHFLLQGSRAKCKHFINRYKSLTGLWISQRYGQSKHIKDLPASIIPVKTEEAILETIAYIDRNSLMAGFKGLPYDYPWSSSRLMFRKTDRGSAVRNLGEFSRNQLRDLLKTRVELPVDWTFGENGMLNPACFTEWQNAEKIFKTPVRHLYFVTRKLEGKIDLELAQGHKTFIPDKDLRVIVRDMSKKEFGESDVRKLPIRSRLTLARTLRREYASTPKQISRMLHIDADLLKGFV